MLAIERRTHGCGTPLFFHWFFAGCFRLNPLMLMSLVAVASAFHGHFNNSRSMALFLLSSSS